MDTRRNLHRARVARSMDLDRVSALTALSPAIVRKIDDGRFEELPGGVYARSYVRSFAEVVGIAPDEALKQIEPLLPPAPDPLPALREHVIPDPGDWLAGQISNLARHLPRLAPLPLARLANADTGWLRRVTAATIDALILVGVGAATASLAAWICGVSFEALLDQAGLALGAVLIVPFVLYFVVFQGIAGRTPGATLCRLPLTRSTGELRLHMIAARTFKS